MQGKACFTLHLPLPSAFADVSLINSFSCRLEKGTTYNSYIIYGDKTALVDASHEKFRGLYMDTLKKELKAKGRSLDYVVVSHTEPDHSGEPLSPSPLPAIAVAGVSDSPLPLNRSADGCRASAVLSLGCP